MEKMFFLKFCKTNDKKYIEYSLDNKKWEFFDDFSNLPETEVHNKLHSLLYVFEELPETASAILSEDL